MANEQELRQARAQKGEALREAGTTPFPNTFRPTDEEREARASLVALALADDEARASLPEENDLTGEEQLLPLYGRVMAKRGPFLVLQTPHGQAQALVRKDKLPEQEAAQLAALDLADHVLVRGPLIRTRTGALAVSARSYAHLGKAMLPPPAKWHGLKDVEKRYRERYVDLFANGDVADVFRARGLVIRALREFLDQRDFLEVETPTLHSVRGGATARPFNTHHNALDMDLFLRIAPELYLKRLLVGGFDRVYEVARCFRNEGISTRHNPEFSMLEYYMAYATDVELREQTVALIRHLDDTVRAKFPHLCEERPFDLQAEWKTVTMRDAIVDAAAHLEMPAVTREALADEEATLAFFGEISGKLEHLDRKLVEKARNQGERVFALYEVLSEPLLTTLYRTPDGEKSVPVFIIEYPFEVSPLARKNDADPRYVDRFELFVDGREIANAFSELNDPDDQADRFRAQLESRASGNDEAMDFDDDYIRALSHGMPPAGGFGMGIDRVVMLLTGQPSIRDVLLFPLLRPDA